MATPREPSTVRFFYVKNALFRVVHVDGAIGGVTPRGLIHMAVFSERPAIPQSSEQEITAQGTLGAERGKEGKEGIVRELDVDLILSKQSATDLRDWLSARLKELEGVEMEIQKVRGDKS